MGGLRKDIANILYIARSTVTAHKANIFRSLNIRRFLELVIRAGHLGIIDLEELGNMQVCHWDYLVTPLPEKQRTMSREKRAKKSAGRGEKKNEQREIRRIV